MLKKTILTHFVWLNFCLMLLLMATEVSYAEAPAPGINPGYRIQEAYIERVISYQGLLKDNAGNPVGNGNYNLTFRIYDSANAGLLLWTSPMTMVSTTNGIFSAYVGPINLPFDTTYFFSVQVQGESEMSPRQRIVSSPYASSADTANFAFASNSQWTRSGNAIYTSQYLGIARGGAGNILLGDSIQSMVNIGVNCTTGTATQNSGFCAIGGGRLNTARSDWSTVAGGNQNNASATGAAIAGGSSNNASGTLSFIGSGAGNTASALHSTIGGGWRNEAAAEKSAICGGSENTVSGYQGFIGGGGSNQASAERASIMGGALNIADGDYGAIGGGFRDTVSALYGGVFSGFYNRAGDAAVDTGAFVGGGQSNSSLASFATVAGGQENIANGNWSAVGGGRSNMSNSRYSSIAGGEDNTAGNDWATVSGGSTNWANGIGSSVAGGRYNTCSGLYSAIPGGYGDTVATNSDYSLVFGRGAWCNVSYRVYFYDSSYPGRVAINRDSRDGNATQPLQIGTDASNGNGAYLTNGGVWTNGSSRTFKENFTPFNGSELLSKISNLSVTTYNYKNSTEKHIGPVAEDFVGAFDTGVIRESDGRRDDMYLSSGDVAGVALAGVQEILKKIAELEIRNSQLEAKNSELEKRINQMENKQ